MVFFRAAVWFFPNYVWDVISRGLGILGSPERSSKTFHFGEHIDRYESISVIYDGDASAVREIAFAKTARLYWDGFCLFRDWASSILHLKNRAEFLPERQGYLVCPALGVALVDFGEVECENPHVVVFKEGVEFFGLRWCFSQR